MKLDATNQSHQMQAIVNSSEFRKESCLTRLKLLVEETSNVNCIWDPDSEPELEPDYDFDPYRNPPLEEIFWDWWRYDYTNRITGIID